MCVFFLLVAVFFLFYRSNTNKPENMSTVLFNLSVVPFFNSVILLLSLWLLFSHAWNVNVCARQHWCLVCRFPRTKKTWIQLVHRKQTKRHHTKYSHSIECFFSVCFRVFKWNDEKKMFLSVFRSWNRWNAKCGKIKPVTLWINE